MPKLPFKSSQGIQNTGGIYHQQATTEYTQHLATQGGLLLASPGSLLAM